MNEQIDHWLPDFSRFAQEALLNREQETLVCFTIRISEMNMEHLLKCFHQPHIQPSWLWHHPATERTLLGAGSAMNCVAQGIDRWRHLSEQVKMAQTKVLASDWQAVRWMGGAAFDVGPRVAPWLGWDDATLVLPRFLWERDGREFRFTVSIHWQPGNNIEALLMEVSQDWNDLWKPRASNETIGNSAGNGVSDHLGHTNRPDAAEHDWSGAVSRTAADIREGRFSKVVLARCARQPLPSQLTVPDVIMRLASAYPDSYVFAVARDDECFLGATPERLVSVRGGEVMVDCLAGTVGRGATPDADDALGQELLESVKDREEHAVVYRWIHNRLEGVVEQWEAPTEPILKKLRNVQHLYTPIRARTKESLGVLEMACRLHPTPAVAGVPREAAMRVLRNRERMDRGWYAGFVGWQGLDGDGEYSVALRCALLTTTEAHLYAGGGIMGDSNPEREWQETRMKMKPMESALGLNGEETVNGGQ